MMTGPTILTPNCSGSGAGACCSSSLKMYCLTGLHPVPPHATGQCGTAQPLALRMRCHVTRSCFSSRRASTILRRIGSGSAVRMNARTSSRNAISSGVKRKSMVAPSIYLKQPGGAHAAADAHGDDSALGAAAPPFDQDMAGHARSAHATGVADRDRTAVDIETFLRDAKPIAAIQQLAGESFVKLPQIDVVNIEPLPRQQLRHGKHRTDPH